MKLTKEGLNKYITLYLNDIEDYGTTEEKILAESYLSPYSKLIVEGASDTIPYLVESLNFITDPTQKDIIESFIEYVETA